MDDGVDVGILGEQGLHLAGVAELGLDKGDLFAGDALHPREGFLAGVAQVVRHYDFVPRVDKLHAGVAADVAGAAANQNRHDTLSFFVIWAVW